jgi:hypothetical protein
MSSRFIVPASVLVLASCFAVPTAPVYQPPSQAAIQEQQRAAFAQSLGYPTRKTAEELAQTIAQQTKDFKPTGQRDTGHLEAPAPVVIAGLRGTCYTVVFRLAEGATWGRGAEGGLRFDFRSPTGPGSGGPGVVGPGAVASVGCATADGPITLTMAPMVGADPIGAGAVDIEVFSHVLTNAEAEHLEADKQRQIAEQREFADRERAKEQAKLSQGCAKCDARYQGCIGAGRSRSTCQSEYRSCAFEEAGPRYGSACPFPR